MQMFLDLPFFSSLSAEGDTLDLRVFIRSTGWFQSICKPLIWLNKACKRHTRVVNSIIIQLKLVIFFTDAFLKGVPN